MAYNIVAQFRLLDAPCDREASFLDSLQARGMVDWMEKDGKRSTLPSDRLAISLEASTLREAVDKVRLDVRYGLRKADLAGLYIILDADQEILEAGYQGEVPEEWASNWRTFLH